MNQIGNNLSMFDLISRSWQEIKGRFVPFMLLACITPAFSWLMTRLAFGFNPMMLHAAQQQNLLLTLFISVISALAGSYCTAALILFICKRADTPWQALKTAWRPFLRLFGGGLLITVAILTVLALLVILWIVLVAGEDPETSNLFFYYLLILPLVAGLIVLLCAAVLTVYFCLLPYLLVLTDRPVLSCFPAAFRLVKGRFWFTLGLLFLLGLIASGILTAGIVLIIFVSIFCALAVPAALADLASVLWVPVKGLITLLQVPLLALYLDRVSILQAPQKTADGQ